jgi:hypothetical protein
MAHMEGFLLKKSYISYRSRFFQLDGSNLLYKASKEDVKERNLMTLMGDSQVIEFKAKRGKKCFARGEGRREGGKGGGGDWMRGVKAAFGRGVGRSKGGRI